MLTQPDQQTSLIDLYDRLTPYGPVSSTLSKLVRPTIQAAEGKVFVWCDWSAIEARVNPWLAGSQLAYDQVLRYFHDDIDLYIANACDIFGVDDIDKKTPEGEKMRQAGKIAVLSLGFLGSLGAYKAMARGYGLRVSDEEAMRVVGKWGHHGWRGRNTWAINFGNEAWDAFQAAIHSPQTHFTAGRLTFSYEPTLLGGSVLTWLPSGRPLTYPFIREGAQETPDGDEEYMITYRHGSGRARMWAGKCIQGPTQAVAADLLREVLVKLDEHDVTMAHTHDECVLEIAASQENYWKSKLTDIMCELPAWANAELPLAAEPESDFFYHK